MPDNRYRPIMRHILSVLPAAEGVYIVGGSLRDLLCGRTPVDYDLVVSRHPARYARRLGDKTNGHMVVLGKPGTRITRVVSSKYTFDIVALSGRSLTEDLLQRDFTINAMACEIATGKMIDAVDGMQDLQAKRVRMVSETVFSNDAVRLVRAFRIASDLQFVIDPATMCAIRRDAFLIKQAAAERIRDELLKLLGGPQAARYVEQMINAGLLMNILNRPGSSEPDWMPGRKTGTGKRYAPQALSDVENRLRFFPPGFQPALHGAAHDSGFRSAALLKWTILLCCIMSEKVNASRNSRTDAIARDHRTALQPAENICRGLRFSNRATRYVSSLFCNINKLFQIFRTVNRVPAARRPIIRLFQSSGYATPDVVLAASAIRNAVHHDAEGENADFARFTKALLTLYTDHYLPRASMTSPISGRDLIKELGLQPSPLFRSILGYVEEERLLRKRLTREEALHLVRKFLAERQRC